MKGDCCVFPFKYKNHFYNSGTKVDNGNKLWCATTHNYDIDRKWGNCQGKSSNKKVENTIHCNIRLHFVLDSISEQLYDFNTKCSWPCFQHLILFWPNSIFHLDELNIHCHNLFSVHHHQFVFIHFLLNNFGLLFIYIFSLNLLIL